MALDNLISLNLSDEEVKTILDALATIEKIFKGRTVNLTPEERQTYGRLGNRTENWISKIVEYIDRRPELTPMYIDVPEFMNDYDIRTKLKPVMNQLKFLSESIDDTMVLLGHDIYNYSLAYYRNIKLVSRENVPGTTEVYNDLAAQFPFRPAAVPEESGPSIPEENNMEQ
jgi:hypothetical protein